MATLRANKVFSNAIFTLVVIESIEFQSGKMTTGCHLYVSIKPVAVVVCTPGRTYALDMEAKLTTLDELRRSVPELDTFISPPF